MRGRRLSASGLVAVVVAGVVGLLPGSAWARGDAGHGFGRMGPTYARTATVDPLAGPDFELPFVCGTSWTGSSRAGHSPSYYTIDFNQPNDLGRPVLASAPGVVVRTVTLTGSYGRYVVVDHGGGYTSLYAHLNSIGTTVGTYVDQGDLIGYLGTSGNSTGPHLHFEQRLNGAYFAPYFHRTRFRIGTTLASANCADRPVVGDWDADRVTDLGVQHTTSTGSVFETIAGGVTQALAWGGVGDLPAVADYDGDRTSQLGVRRRGSSTWLLRSRSGATATVTGVGAGTDQPLTGDWDGNGRANLGFYRPSTRTFYLRAEDGRLGAVTWGTSGQLPVAGDWNGDGRTDLGGYDPRTGRWTLRVPTGTTWTSQVVSYGTAGDLPAAGDWNGDGVTDLGIWRPSTATFWLRTPQPDGTFRSTTQVVGTRR